MIKCVYLPNDQLFTNVKNKRESSKATHFRRYPVTLEETFLKSTIPRKITTTNRNGKPKWQTSSYVNLGLLSQQPLDMLPYKLESTIT